MPYSEIPNMPIVSVSWHGKELHTGSYAGKRILLWSGRVHMYEGYNRNQVGFISHISGLLGCKTIILTNSSGGGLEGMTLGSVMISTDHLNFTMECPITDAFVDPRFGMKTLKSTECHSTNLFEIAEKAAIEQGLPVFRGIYGWCMGPCFETPLETTTLRRFGAGAFGMSTVPEILEAGQMGMQ
jgi:purine-nucleoside phosphorylase